MGFIRELKEAGITKRSQVSSDGVHMNTYEGLKRDFRRMEGKAQAYSQLCAVMCEGIWETHAGKKIRGVPRGGASYWNDTERRKIKERLRSSEVRQNTILKELRAAKTPREREKVNIEVLQTVKKTKGSKRKKTPSEEVHVRFTYEDRVIGGPHVTGGLTMYDVHRNGLFLPLLRELKSAFTD